MSQQKRQSPSSQASLQASLPAEVFPPRCSALGRPGVGPRRAGRRRQSVDVALEPHRPAPKSSNGASPADAILLSWRRCREVSDRGPAFERAWTDLVECSQRWLRGTVRGQLTRMVLRRPEPSMVDDLCQEVYCRLLADDCRSLRACRATHRAQLIGYLKAVTRSVIVDDLRQRRSVKRGSGRELCFGSLVEIGALPVVASSALCAERRALARESVRLAGERLDQLVAEGRLAERSREIFCRAVVGEESSLELRRRYGIAASTASSIVHRTRRSLRSEVPF